MYLKTLHQKRILYIKYFVFFIKYFLIFIKSQKNRYQISNFQHYIIYSIFYIISDTLYFGYQISKIKQCKLYIL